MIFMSPALRVLYLDNKGKECALLCMWWNLFHSEGDFNYFSQHVSFLHSVIYKQNVMWGQAHSLCSWRSIDCLISYSSNSFGFKDFMFIFRNLEETAFSPVANDSCRIFFTWVLNKSSPLRWLRTEGAKTSLHNSSKSTSRLSDPSPIWISKISIILPLSVTWTCV